MNEFITRICNQKTLTINGMTFQNLNWFGGEYIGFRYFFEEGIYISIVFGDSKITFSFNDYHMEGNKENTIYITEKTDIKDLKRSLNSLILSIKDHFIKRFINLKEQQYKVVGCLETVGFSQSEYDSIMYASPTDYYEESFYREKYADNGEDN